MEGPRFFKVFLPNLCSDYLRIPPAFRKHMEGNFSGMVSLKGPSGNVWNVELVEHSDGLRFENGWKKFVSDHKITKGDFLLFCLKETLCFSVMLFDTTACLKEAAFNVSPFQRDTGVVIDISDDEEEEAEMSREVGELQAQVSSSNMVSQVERKRKLRRISSPAVQQSPCKKTSTSRRDSPLPERSKTSVTGKTMSQDFPHSTTREKRWKDSNTEVQENSNNKLISSRITSTVKEIKSDLDNDGSAKSRPLTRLFTRQLCRKEVDGIIPSEEDCKPSERLGLRKSSKESGKIVAKSNIQSNLVSQRRLVTVEEVDNCLQRAKAFQSRNPFFLVVMQDSYVYARRYLRFPHAFWTSHMSNISQKIIVWDPKGKPWPITCVTSGQRACFSAGWGAFSSANNLEKFDVCIFELFERHHFKVHIFRVVAEITPLKCSPKKQCSHL